MFFTKGWPGMIRLASRRGPGPQRRWHRPTRRLYLEPLEDRCLLASGLSAALVADIVPGSDSSNPEGMSNIGGTLYFGAISNGAWGLFKSDGTGDGTVLVKGNLPGFLDKFTPMNGFVFFEVRQANAQLWRTDGTAAGTIFVHALSGLELTPLNGKLFFANAGNGGTELWASDGTTNGTAQIKDIYPGITTLSYVVHDPYGGKPQHVTYTYVNGSSPQWLTCLNGTLYFAATDGSNGSELWRSDGTAQGTVMVKNITKGSKGSDPKNLTVVNGILYFGAAGKLWKSDGTEAGTVVVKNVDAAYLRNVNGTLFFAGADSTYGTELWKSDGTTAGTVMVKEINPGSAGSLTEEFFIGSGNANGQLYFSANDGVHGREAWTTDGTPAGTVLLKDINPGSDDSGPGWFTNVNGLVYFEAYDPTNGQELWQTDGTHAGTVLVQDIYPGSVGSSPNDLTSLNNKLYFDAFEPVHGRELWDPPAVEAPAIAETAGGHLVVGSFNNNSVLRYDEQTGAFVDQFDPRNLGNLKNPSAGVFGPDDNLYVSSGVFLNNNQKMLQYNGTTGAYEKTFASPNITSPRGVLFGPDGNIYVANGNSAADGDPASVERFDGKTGAFLNYFVAPNSGGIEHPSYMVFGPDGKKDGKLDLYVANAHEGSILRYDGATGASKGVFVSAANGGLDAPQGIVFGPDGNLYVASGNWFNGSNGPFYTGVFPPGAVLRFQGPSGRNPGSFLGTFIPAGSGGLANPNGMVFGLDPSGNGKTDLYVANSIQSGNGGPLIAEPGTSNVLRYDATTGAFLGAFVTPDSGGLKFPTFITFTETNPTTLNYIASGPATTFEQTPVAVLTQPASAARLTTPPLASAVPLVVSTTGPLVPISNPDPLATCPQSANNWLSFAPNGDLYSIGGAFGKLTPLILLNKSTDGGETWSVRISAVAQQRLVDPNVKPATTLVTDPDTGLIFDQFMTRFGDNGLIDQMFTDVDCLSELPGEQKWR